MKKRKGLLSVTSTALSLPLALLLASCNGSDGDSAVGPVPIQEAQVNPEFEEWLADPSKWEREIPGEPGRFAGYRPSPFLSPETDGDPAPSSALGGLEDGPFSKDRALPARYDLRELGQLTAVRNQGSYGTCWAHAAMGSMESTIKKSVGADMNLSEWHLAYYTYTPMNGFPAFDGSAYGEGCDQFALAIMARGARAGGPVSEASAPYGRGTPSAAAPAALALKNAYVLGNIYKDRDTVKRLVQDYGAVGVVLDMGSVNSAAAYRTTSSGFNHAVNIVGWDDNFARNKFPAGNQPSSNGAWIVRNSWGASWGDKGYFYVSYDTPLGHFTVFESTADTSKKTYQYDMHGRINAVGYNANTAWFANIFAAAGDEKVTEVAFYTSTKNASYEVTIRTGVGATPATGAAHAPMSGTLELPGYHRVKLDTPVNVSGKEKFAVVVRLTENGYNYPVAISRAYGGITSSAKATKGVGFMSPNGTTQWSDITSTLLNPTFATGSYIYGTTGNLTPVSTASVCLKAFTEPSTNVPATAVSLDRPAMTLGEGDQEQLCAAVQPDDATNHNVAWASSNEAIATVSSSGLVTAVKEGTADITATTQDGNHKATCRVTVATATVAATGVSLDKTAAALAVGGQEQLYAAVQPSNATNRSVTWASSNEAIATVSAGGLVTGVGAGTADITVRTQDGNHKAACKVTVAPLAATGVSLSKPATTLMAGSHEQLYAAVQPDGATNKSVSWSSGDSSIATVTSGGLVAGVKEGTADITVATQDGNHRATCTVTVTTATAAVASVSLDKTAMTLAAGTHGQLTALIHPSNATNQNVAWASSNSAIAAVSSGGLVTGVGIGTAEITVATQDGDHKAKCTVTVAPVAVTGVSLNKPAAALSAGGQEQLYATVQPSGAANQAVTWSSSDGAVATVSSSGLVTAVGVGTAEITVATQDGNKTAKCRVTVAPTAATGVSLDKAAMTLSAGDQWQLLATVRPSGATNKSVTWSSGNSAVATVSTSGLVTAVGIGAAEITATTQDGSHAAKCAVTVSNSAAVAGVSLDKAEMTLTGANDQGQLTATVRPSSATNQSVTWASSNSTVAVVSGRGLVTGASVGTAVITATTQDGNHKAACAVTVVPRAVSGVSLNKAAATLKEGGQEQLTATVAPSDATYKTVAWASSDSTIATVSASGLVKGMRVGTADITVTTQDGGKTATCAVTVTPIAVTSVSLSKSATTLKEGGQEQLAATVLPSNATNKTVTWASSSTAIATVSSSGLVTAVSTGTAEITVTTQDGNYKATCAVTVVPMVSTFATMSAGEDHALAIRTDGSLWAWGRGSLGQLGRGLVGDSDKPVRVAGTDKDWKSVSAGIESSFAIKTDGSLWAWGYNGGGQLGLGDTANRNSPARVGAANDWAAVSAGGSNFTVAIKADGSLWAWGNNKYGQLGLGDTANRNSPARVGAANDWAAVSIGDKYAMALKADGSLWAWGNNASGQLGHGDTANRNSPVRVGDGADWKTVSAGVTHTLAIKADGSLWAWGSSTPGALGLFNTTSASSPVRVSAANWAAAYAGYHQSMGIRADGVDWWLWGADASGYNKNLPYVRVDSSGHAGCVISLAKDIWYLELEPSGRLYAKGSNSFGRLGLGDKTAGYGYVE